MSLNCLCIYFYPRILQKLIGSVFLLATLNGHSTVIKHAENFTLFEYEGYTQLEVRNASLDSGKTSTYFLVPKTGSIPSVIPKDATIIRTPVERVLIMETVYIGFLEALDSLESITGAATTDFITNPKVLERIRNTKIRRVQNGQELDIERILLLNPDIILTSISGSSGLDIQSELGRTGIPVVLTAGYMEKTPLARAEWLKFIAAFYNLVAKAEAIFEGTAQRYEALKDTISHIPEGERPTVLCAAPYGGIWHVPGGNSYMATAINDAGGAYIWADDARTGSIPLDIERVFYKASQADIWINPSHYRSMKALLAAEPRFREFRASKNQSVFNNTRKVGANGGNAIWEEGVVRPDAVLADMVKIFHPEMLPDWTFTFYEQLP